MSVVNGQLANQTTFNNAFMSRTAASTSTVAKIALSNLEVDSGASITNAQRAINKSFDTVGITDEVDATAKVYSSNEVLIDGDSHKQSLEKLDLNFSGTTGHAHTGATGQGPKLTPTSLEGYKLQGRFVAGTNFTTTASSSDIVTSILLDAVSLGDTQEGAVANAPYNKVILQDENSDEITDGEGNEVYARLTNDGTDYTLSYLVLIAGVETSYTFTSPTDIKWFYQKIFDPLTNIPVYDQLAFIPSENTTADVIDATETAAGKVLLSNVAALSVAAVNAKGTSSRVSHEDHTHRGISSLSKLGEAAQYGDFTIEQGTGVTLTQTAGSIKIDADASIAVTQQTLDGTLAITGTGRRRIVEVQSSGGEVDLSALGIAAGLSGDELFLVGLSNDNYIILKKTATVEINGDWYSFEGKVLHLIYRSSKWTGVN